ncbi:hypothetical protein HX910_002233 [Salmonella enterica]|nr:hypothetical protein [Salmonella enterica]EFP4635189.1 hypothetical protein [Salmonella enterica]EFS0363649.1 hypothetical protein [Salmonella enterica]EGK1505959.1 hypothetical protein [Salmonella enterica]
MIKNLSQLLLIAFLITSGSALAATSPEIKQPEAPITAITSINVSPGDIDSAVKAWDSRTASLTKAPGFISATLYQSVLPDHPWPLIEVAQWQSYTTWTKAHDNADRNLLTGFYRPAVAYVNFTARQEGQTSEALLDRVKKDPAFSHPGAPFIFINLMEMTPKDATTFIADWKIRSQLTRQQAGSMNATLYRAVLPDERYSIINVSQWQSYNAFVDAQNDPTYSRQLQNNLNQTSSIKLIRGFFRPVAYQIQTYD